MHFDSEHTFSIAQPDSHSDSFKLKLTFTERALQRAKEENNRLSQKLLRAEQQNASLADSQKALLQKTQKLEMAINRERLEKQGLIKKLEVRTQRHEAQQSQFLTKGQKQVMEKKIKGIEADLSALNEEKIFLIKKCQGLTAELDQQRRYRTQLQQQIISLQKHNLEDIDKNQEVEQLYHDKIALLQSENADLKKQIDSLIIQVKLFERKKEIQNLLDYENRIGVESPPKSTRKSILWSRVNDKSNRADRCCCAGLEEQVCQREELIELLKEKNGRLWGELETLKKRCVTLQNIVCRSDGCMK